MAPCSSRWNLVEEIKSTPPQWNHGTNPLMINFMWHTKVEQSMYSTEERIQKLLSIHLVCKGQSRRSRNISSIRIRRWSSHHISSFFLPARRADKAAQQTKKRKRRKRKRSGRGRGRRRNEKRTRKRKRTPREVHAVGRVGYLSERNLSKRAWRWSRDDEILL